MSTQFSNRVFGCVVVKSINSNYNADFSHQPRTLPDGTVYATDKVLKYSVRNYFKKVYPTDKIFFFKSMNPEMQPRDLGETYIEFFGALPSNTGKDKEVLNRKAVLKNLLTCTDIRLFGGTFAQKDVSLSLHGTTQITHGVNRFPENAIYSEQISSPFRNANEKSTDSMQTTLGSQFKLREGHYVHHFSVNPQNLDELVKVSEGTALNTDDIAKLKAGLSKGVTFYDSSAKAGTENELMLWVQLKSDSKLVLPSFVELITIGDDRVIDMTKVSEILARADVQKHIESIEIYYDATATKVLKVPTGAVKHEIYQ
jgi:CRISPR-associated protein Csh2